MVTGNIMELYIYILIFTVYIIMYIHLINRIFLIFFGDKSILLIAHVIYDDNIIEATIRFRLSHITVIFFFFLRYNNTVLFSV